MKVINVVAPENLREEIPARGLLTLPRHHADPFDRMLISQELEEGLTLFTHDRKFELYPLKILWT